MVWIKKHFWEILLMSGLIVIGFYFRLKGISTNHSFWSDEAYISGIAKDIFYGKTQIYEGLRELKYQPFQVISILISFEVIGVSEWAARIPSVIWGTAGILMSFLVAKKYSNYWGGVLAAFLYTFLQLNLANSTQAKPYTAIQTLYLFTIYLCGLLTEKSKFKNTWIIYLTAFISAIVATLYHYLGIICLVYYCIYILPTVINYAKRLPKKYIIPPILITVLVVSYLLRIDQMVLLFTRPLVNNLTYLRELLWRQYAFLTLPAVFGLLLIKEKKSKFGIAVSILPLIFLWTFFQESKNIRYLLPVFAIIPVGFGIFWAEVGKLLFNKSMLVCCIIAIIIFVGGYKIVRKPAIYYTPNADFFADVQNADYKTLYKAIYEKFPGFDSIPYFSNNFDHGSWYTSHYPTAMFMKIDNSPVMHGYYPSMVYKDLKYFIAEQKKYPKGLVIVEDWQSFMPDDIKEFVKKNMRLELKIESMSVSPDDKWPLELYSWGMDRKSK